LGHLFGDGFRVSGPCPVPPVFLVAVLRIHPLMPYMVPVLGLGSGARPVRSDIRTVPLIKSFPCWITKKKGSFSQTEYSYKVDIAKNLLIIYYYPAYFAFIYTRKSIV
jgi:hypothetical protein